MFDGIGYIIPPVQTESSKIDSIKYKLEEILYIYMYGLYAVQNLPSF